MEEIVTTDAIRKEILDDARKKAEHLLKEADEEIARAKAAGAQSTGAQVAEIEKSSAQRVARLRAETLARVPLEKTRIKTAFVDRRVREAFERFMADLPEPRVLELAGVLLRGSGSFLEGKELRVRCKGVSTKSARDLVVKAYAGAKLAEPVLDASLPASGLVVETADGSVTVRATLDLIEENLLGMKRGELARALCAEALNL